jgi:hypothetical protein
MQKLRQMLLNFKNLFDKYRGTRFKMLTGRYCRVAHESVLYIVSPFVILSQLSKYCNEIIITL